MGGREAVQAEEAMARSNDDDREALTNNPTIEECRVQPGTETNK
jgi:hypothetical protein